MSKEHASEGMSSRMRLLIALFFLAPLFAFGAGASSNAAEAKKKEAVDSPAEVKPDQNKQKLATAIFAGGCFWCMEPPFEKLEGVKAVESGYTGGKIANPTYEQVSNEETGHYEAVRVSYDPKVVSYEKLLEVFWRQIDPTDPNGQFVDQGSSYRSAIFYGSEDEKKLAEKSKEVLAKSGRFKEPIVTPVIAAKEFYLAEDYHQDYYKKSAIRYKYYRFRSGRDQFLEKHWGKDAAK